MFVDHGVLFTVVQIVRFNVEPYVLDTVFQRALEGVILHAMAVQHVRGHVKIVVLQIVLMDVDMVVVLLVKVAVR